MLGGTVWIALIRFVISLGGVILLFSRISKSRFEPKKTLFCYIGFSIMIIIAACTWYVFAWDSCVRMVAFVMYLCFSLLAIYISGDRIFLTVYKLAFIFYLMAVFLIVGIEISILFFDRNAWADIVARIVLIVIMTLFIERKIKISLLNFSDYVESELDRFSAAVMIISLLFGIGFILNPNVKEQTPYRLFQISMNFFLTAALQLLVYRLYLHIGKEKEYQKENQLIQMNHRLLERNMELLEEAAVDGRRIRHNMRYHNAVITEYALKGQTEELLQYLRQYKQELEENAPQIICDNTTLNHLLLIYTRWAKRENIEVELDVEIGTDFPVPGINLVTILANAYENAIYGCIEVKMCGDLRKCFISLMMKKKGNKLVICCKNTCRFETELKSKSDFSGNISVSGIVKAVEEYGGEYDFKNDNGIFIFRLIMNLSQDNNQKDNVALRDKEKNTEIETKGV